MRILIVDDDIVQVTLLTEILEIYEGDTVTNGDDAFIQFKQAFIESKPYAFIIMDLMMPGFDGYMIIEAIRQYEKSENLPRTPIIVVSGKPADSGLTDKLNEQCDDYLVKPVTSDIILRSLENLNLI